MTLTPVDVALLEALERFRLLTIGQGERLGLANYRHVAERFRRLTAAKLVHMTERGRHIGPHVFCLAAGGARALAAWREDEETLPDFRREPYRESAHLPQRILTVDLHITLRAWAARVGAGVAWVRVNLDRNPRALSPATAVEHRGAKAEPDMIAALTTNDGRHWLLAFEVETGGASNRLSNFSAHLRERVEALRGRVLENGCDWPADADHKAARLLFVFETPAMLAGARKKVQGAEGPEWRRVFFGVLFTDPATFGSGWWTAAGTEGGFLPIGGP